MVPEFEETVGYDKETVAFNKALTFLKKRYRIFYKEVYAEIDIDEKAGEQIRAGRRRASNEEIKTLVKKYPETAQFFINDTYILEDDKTTNQNTLNEPEQMGTQFYGKHVSHRDELVETQRKLIAKLEDELEQVKRKLNIVEGEKKALIEIVSQRK